MRTSLLVGEALVAAEQVDDAAIGEAVALDYVTHDDVVAMGVDAQVTSHCHAVVHHVIEDTMTAGGTGQAVDDVVWLVVKPLAIVNSLVGRFRSRDEGKRGHYFPALLNAEVAVAVIDVIIYRHAAGIAVDPLVHVAA